jgi:hypothetical protein
VVLNEPEVPYPRCNLAKPAISVRGKISTTQIMQVPAHKVAFQSDLYMLTWMGQLTRDTGLCQIGCIERHPRFFVHHKIDV